MVGVLVVGVTWVCFWRCLGSAVVIKSLLWSFLHLVGGGICLGLHLSAVLSNCVCLWSWISAGMFGELYV